MLLNKCKLTMKNCACIAMAVAKQQLGVEPVVTAKDMADPAVGHLGVMAYAASFQRASLSEPPPVDIRASLANSREQLSSNFLRPASSSAAADLLDVQVETALYTEMYPVCLAYCFSAYLLDK